ncbi:MAG: hypothetical protein KA096_02510 [Bacteroidales bacterium]|nr:hypothetical protein [Bacteroidales bacterium]
MSFFFFRKPKPRQFNYKPLYYDPDTEEAMERKKIREGLQSSDPGERLRAQIRRRWRKESAPADSRPQVIRFAFYVIIAAFAIYFIFFTDIINKIVTLFVR